MMKEEEGEKGLHIQCTVGACSVPRVRHLTFDCPSHPQARGWALTFIPSGRLFSWAAFHLLLSALQWSIKSSGTFCLVKPNHFHVISLILATQTSAKTFSSFHFVRKKSWFVIQQENSMIDHNIKHNPNRIKKNTTYHSVIEKII